MDVVHQRVLNEMMAEIMGRISDPDSMASCLIVLTPMDREKVECIKQNYGDRKGTEELLKRLKKRGRSAFSAFLEQLRKPDNDYSDLADEIERKVEIHRLRNRCHSSPAISHSSSYEESLTAEREDDDDPFPKTSSMQRSNTGPASLGHVSLVKQPVVEVDTKLVRQPNVVEVDIEQKTVEPPLEISKSKLPTGNVVAPLRNTLQMKEVQKVSQPTKEHKETHVEMPARQYDTSENPSTDESGAQSKIVFSDSSQEGPVSAPPRLQMEAEDPKKCTEEAKCAKRGTSLSNEYNMLRKIPVRVKNRVVKMLNHNQGNNWKNVAGAMGLTVEEVFEYDNDSNKGKMEGLFDRMVQEEKTVSDLVLWLNNEDVKRLDVIDIFRQERLITDVLEKQLRDSRSAEEDVSKSPMPCTDAKASFIAGSPVLCSEVQQTVAKSSISLREIKKDYQQQPSPPFGKPLGDVLVNGDTVPQKPQIRGTWNAEEPGRETLLSYRAHTPSSLPPYSPSANNLKEDFETDSPTQCTHSLKGSKNQQSRGTNSKSNTSNSSSPTQSTSLNAVAPSTNSATSRGFILEKNTPRDNLPTQCASLSAVTKKEDSEASSTIVQGNVPTQCTSLKVVSSSSSDSAYRVDGNKPKQGESLKVGALAEEDCVEKNTSGGNLPTQCASLNTVKSSKKETSDASSAIVKGNVPTQCTSLKVVSSSSSDSAYRVDGNIPKQCESLKVDPLAEEDCVEKNTSGGNLPTQCASWNAVNSSEKEPCEASIAIVKGNVPTQCTSLKVVSSKENDSSNKVDENIPKQCESLKVDPLAEEDCVEKNTPGGNLPTQCASLNAKNSSKKEPCEASIAIVKGNVPTQCTSLKVVSSKENHSSNRVNENMPKQCESLKVDPPAEEDCVAKNAVDLACGNGPTQCTSFRLPTEDSVAKKTADLVEGSTQTQCGNLNTTALSASSLIPTQCSSLNTTMSQKTPVEEETGEKPIDSLQLDVPGGCSCTENHKESCCSPVACTDVEKSKADELGNTYEEHIKVRNLNNNVQSSPVDDETNEDVFYSDEFGRSALIVCCEKYQNLTPLDELSQRAKELLKLLQDAGWSVSTAFDCSTAVMQNVFEDFLETTGSGKSEACLVFLIGHTVQIQGDNYLLPVDVTTDFNRADVVHMALSLSCVLKRLEEKSYLHIVFVDGAHENKQPLKCYGAFPGLASVHTPPNCIVAFPCNPGVERSSNERLVYIECLIEQLRNPGLTLREVLANVAEAMTNAKTKCTSTPCTLSLTPSLVPFCIVTPGNETKVSSIGPVGIQVPQRAIPKRALIMCNCLYEKNSLPMSVYEDARKLKHALDKANWTVTDVCDRKTANMAKKVREFLGDMKGEREIVMVYFIGFAKQIRGRNCLFGTDWSASDQMEISRYAITTQWLLDLMCELVSGPRILVVDDMNTSGPDGLVFPRVPQETLVSLPCAREVRCLEEEQNSFSHQSTLFSALGSLISWFSGSLWGSKSPELSYSRVLAQRLEANPHGSLREIFSKNSMQGHKVEENLFFA